MPETQEKMDILAAEMEKYMDEKIRKQKIKIAKSNKQWVGTYEKIRVNKMDMDKTEKNQEKFTCGEFEYQS